VVQKGLSGSERYILNPRSEARISKQIQMFKIQNSKQHQHMWTKSDSAKEEGFGAFEFGISYLFRISILDIRMF
jgi:hypothetical protein